MLNLYNTLFLKRPVLSLFFSLLIVLGFCSQIPHFKLDASADSLVLENDQSLRYFREIYSRYSSNDYLVLTYTPHQKLFSEESLQKLKELRNEISLLDGVDSVVTILDVPLLFSPKVSLSSLSEKTNTLETPGIDLNLAQKEFKDNPIYSKQLLSPDGQTTALLVNLPIELDLRNLLHRRTELRSKKYHKTISSEEAAELDIVTAEYRRHLTELTNKQNVNVIQIRGIISKYKGSANLFLGGVPMIIADMISFIKNDLIIFSLGVLFFLIITLATIFKRIRWVLLPMACCFAAGLTMMGILGYMDWRVTVISSNFISLMLIITMSLTIHLIVRYRELCVIMPDADQQTLLLETVRLKAQPCLYTTLTTVVAFTSLLVSSIRPVMDFGMMMTMGLAASYLLSFAIFPAGAMLLDREHISTSNKTRKSFTLRFAILTEHHGTKILITSILLTVLSFIGISKLVVENRFIDYFRQSTEIYQGMKLIDEKLGGTTPLDVIINFKDTKVKKKNPATNSQTDSSLDDDLLSDDLFNDPLSEENLLDANLLGDNLLAQDLTDDDLLDSDLLGNDPFAEKNNLSKQADDFSADKYWFTAYKMEKIEKIHDYLNSLPETGKVLSLATIIKLSTALNDNIPLDDYELAILYDKLPDNLKDMLVAPYASIPDNQTRITMRVKESDNTLQREELLNRIRSFLVDDMGFAHDQIHFTNMLVLYNNMLQSLFRSQIMTIGVVFLGIMLMFIILFRSLSLAIIAIIPNLLPAAMVLGVMGWVHIPLDMMTITIAAITIGIAVDDTIHYIHRFKKEFMKDRNYMATMYRCHASIGKAMYYTSLTIIIGFSILVLSNFVPTIYFGLFTGFGMLAALLAALTLLPQLLLMIKPLGPEGNQV